jgi:hypothetical protein
MRIAAVNFDSLLSIDPCDKQLWNLHVEVPIAEMETSHIATQFITQFG